MSETYWRWKSDRLWQKTKIEMLGNGLARLYVNEFRANDCIVVSLDEIDRKDVQNEQPTIRH